MAVSLKHTTQAVGTDAGNGEIRKAQWNEEHTLTAAANTVLGAVSAGAVGEITCTAAGRALLDDADAAAQRATLSAAGTGVSNTFSANQIIEVTDNTNAALRVTQLGTGNAILVEDSTNPDATPFVVTGDGTVAAGWAGGTLTTAYGSIYQKIQAVVTAPGPQIIAATYSDSVYGPRVDLVKSRSTTPNGQALLSANDDLGSINWCGSDGTSVIPAAAVYANVDGTPGTNDMPGRLAFATTADGASSLTERMRIRSDGNIGIGGAGNAATSLSIQKAITGGTVAVGAEVVATIQSDVTSGGLGYNTSLSTQAASFSTILQHYRALQGTFGAGSTVSLQIGFNSTASLIGATDNQAFRASDTAAVTSGKIAYGFYSAINTATGGGTTYGFYAAGTARNLFSGDVQVFGAGGLGYTTGSGGAVTQATSRTTGVTLNKTNGAITLVSAAGSTTWQSFTVTNSTVAATDTVIVSQKSGTDLHMISVTAVAAGSFRISFATTGGTTTEQPVFNFAVIKAVTA